MFENVLAKLNKILSEFVRQIEKCLRSVFAFLSFALKQILDFFSLITKYLAEKIKRKKSNRIENFKTYMRYVRVVNAHFQEILPNMAKLLEETYSIVYSKHVVPLIANNVNYVDYDSEEFINILYEFFEQMKVICGRNVYNSLIKLWGDEDLFREYVALWVYTRVSVDISSILRERIDKVKNIRSV